MIWYNIFCIGKLFFGLLSVIERWQLFLMKKAQRLQLYLYGKQINFYSAVYCDKDKRKYIT